MTTSNILAITEMASTQNNRSVTFNEALAKLEVGAMTLSAVSLGENSPIGTPTDAEGDVYVVGTSGAGEWAGQSNNIAIYYNADWIFIPAVEGMRAWVVDESKWYQFNGTTWDESGANNYYDIGFGFGATPGASEVVGKHVAVRSITIPSDMAGSRGHVGTNPTSGFNIDVNKNGGFVGTIAVDTSGNFTFTTDGTPATEITLVAGDRLEFVAPSSADATIENLSATIIGTVA